MCFIKFEPTGIFFWTQKTLRDFGRFQGSGNPISPACSSQQIAFPLSLAISSCLLSFCAHTRSPYRLPETGLLPTLATAMLLSARSDTPLCLPLPPCCLTLTQRLGLEFCRCYGSGIQLSLPNLQSVQKHTRHLALTHHWQPAMTGMYFWVSSWQGAGASICRPTRWAICLPRLCAHPWLGSWACLAGGSSLPGLVPARGEKARTPQSVAVLLELGEPGRDGESLGSSLAVTMPRSQWAFQPDDRARRGRSPALFVAWRHSFGISLAFGKAALWGRASVSRWCGEGRSRHMDSFASCLQLPLWGRMEGFPDLVAVPAS